MENQLEEECRAGKAHHRLGTELSLIFACCYKLRQTSDSVLSGDQLMLLQQIQKSAEAIRDLRPELTADADEF
jgi:hypothetical protein